MAEVLRAASAAEARPGAPCHIAAVWLAALLWLEDARWRKLRSGGAPTDAVEGLLDALSRRVLLLNLPPPAHEPAPTTPSGAGSDAFEPQPCPSGSAQAPVSPDPCAILAAHQMLSSTAMIINASYGAVGAT